MKSPLLIGAFIAMAIAACTKQNGSPTETLNERIDTVAVPAGYRGVFSNGPYGSVSGTADIYSQGGHYVLSLQDMAISNGPDLHVYLSKEMIPLNFIDLGRLKSTSGNQLYDISGMPDFTEYKYALIHCQRYNHLFGFAAFK